ncbi:sugar ABC transporter ATP-binding protein [Anaeromicrobium sediminis]|uniref:Sugar ABC transporter ATP-binding protein n=1 Tax=Anaeromicrobium sediminis TaxID=1478221 RepID=A0A267MM97_9FIRM|nr:sugar ABC transporter ATP-binding protein [Anaeromicrobium sediminis]PAB60734.1 sugar ABC transporter ATP-binding protein [Anaeromicrobium sediminis]
MSEYVLEMRNIKKDYFGNKVLKGIDLKVEKGEVYALLGENGAGKSTLMNILFGMPVIHSTGGFEGEVLIDGKKVNINSPQMAMEMGIGMVHQEFMLIPGFTISENIKLNRETLKDNGFSRVFGQSLKTLDTKSMDKDARVALDKLDMNIDEWVKVSGLPVGYMQFIEIAREIDKLNVKLLVFDEPTAVLTESEADNLLDAMRRITDSGISIIFITHRLDEVMNVSKNISILRDGESVAALKKVDTNVMELAELMVGRKIEGLSDINEGSQDYENREIAVKAKDFVVEMPGEEVKGIDLEIYKGEIFGIGGLAGQGKIGVANGIMGLYPSQGEVYINGKELTLNSPIDSLKSGLSFVSEDRREVGLLLDESIENNIAMTAMQVNEKFLKKFGFFSHKDTKHIRNHANNMVEQFDIRCVGPHQLTRRLSGGNQQKVCLARAITLEPNILLVSEPTRGIDIGAKKLVLDVLKELNEKQGMTIIMTSSELGELRSICDRIAIVTEGKVEGILRPNDSDVDFGLMMSGDYHKANRKEAK